MNDAPQESSSTPDPPDLDRTLEAAAVQTVASGIDVSYTEHPTWWQFSLDFRSTTDPDDAVGDPLADDDELPDQDDDSAEGDHPPEKLARQAALLAFSYVVEFADEQGRSRFVLGPFSRVNDDSWPQPPDKVPAEVAQWWPGLAAAVTTAAPRARLYAVCFLRGGQDRAQHGRDAATAYLAAAEEAGRKPETVEYLQSALRIGRALNARDLVEEALGKLLDFAAAELESPDAGLGFAVQALEVAAAEPACPPRVDELAEKLSATARFVPIADRGLQILLERADEAGKPIVWGRRIDLHRAEAMAADQPAVKIYKLQRALQLADKAGDRTRREQLASDLQTCAREDVGMIHFTASSHLYEEEVARQIDALIGNDTWQRALITFATFGPITGDLEINREVVRTRLDASFLHRLMPTHLFGPDGLPSYTGINEEDRFEVELVRWETELITNWSKPLARALHKIPERFGIPTGPDLFHFLKSWPGANPTTVPVLTTALLRYWAGDSDAVTYTTLPQIEGSIRFLVMAEGRGIYRVQQQHKPGQTVGLGALLPILAKTHDIPDERIRTYSAALVHPAGLNLRNQLMHGFGGLTGPDTAAIVLHLLLHLGTLRGRADSSTLVTPPDEELSA